MTGKHRLATREQLVGALVAICDWAGGFEQRRGIDWSAYDRLGVSQIATSLEVVESGNARVRNLHRDLRRKYNYDSLLDVVGPLDAYETEGFYRKMWWQIRANHLVGDTRARFGVDVPTMARMMGCTERLVCNYESFHEFTNDRAMLYAFEQTLSIAFPKAEEWGRKFRRAMREYHACHDVPQESGSL